MQKVSTVEVETMTKREIAIEILRACHGWYIENADTDTCYEPLIKAIIKVLEKRCVERSDAT